MAKSMFYHACVDSGIPRKYIGVTAKDWESDAESLKFANRTIKSLDELIYKSMCLMFVGFYGSGKSFLSSLIAVEAIKQKKIVSYESLFTVLTNLQSERFEKGKNVVDKYFKKFSNSDLVVLNGISPEVWRSASEWSKVAFVDIISRIIANSQKTMLLLNVDVVRNIETSKDAAKLLKNEFEVRFLKLIMDNFKPFVLKKYKGYSAKVSKQWDEVLG